MKCLRIDEIYLYLEGELSSEQTKKIETHLTSCSACENSVEERRRLIHAAESLPDLELPKDFTNQVMGKIFPEKVPLRSWLIALSSGFSSIAAVLFIYFLLSGQNLADFMIGLNQAFVTLARNLSVFCAKFLKLVSLFIKIILQFLGYLINGVSRWTKIPNQEIQVVIITLTLLLSVFLIFKLKRKIFSGEGI
jgi:hypothetical protein